MAKNGLRTASYAPTVEICNAERFVLLLNLMNLWACLILHFLQADFQGATISHREVSAHKHKGRRSSNFPAAKPEVPVLGLGT